MHASKEPAISDSHAKDAIIDFVAGVNGVLNN